MDGCPLSPWAACRPKKDSPAGGRCVPRHSSQQKADWSGAWVPGGRRVGQASSQEHGESRQNGHRRQNKRNAVREKPGCEQGLMTHWQCSWQTGARRWPARGQARLLGTGARSRQGTSPGKAVRSRDGQQGRGWRGWSAGCAVQLGGRTLRGPRGQCVHPAGPVGPRLIQKEGEPPPSREEETSCHQLSKHQQMQQSGCLSEVSETA